MEQMPLFSGSCPRHGPENVCNRCPERFDTDCNGFPHPQVCKGREPLRECNRCRMLVRRAQWHVAEWCCKTCAGAKG